MTTIDETRPESRPFEADVAKLLSLMVIANVDFMKANPGAATKFAQLSLDDLLGSTTDGLDDDHQWQLAEETVDAIRKRFGATAIGPASAVSDRGLRVVQRGAQQWGPDEPAHG